MSQSSQSDPRGTKPLAEAEVTTIDQCELGDRSVGIDATGQSEEIAICEHPIPMSTTCPSTVSSNFEDAAEYLVTIAPQSAAEKGPNHTSGQKSGSEQEVVTSMGQESLEVVAYCTDVFVKEDKGMMDCADQKVTELGMQTDGGTAGVTPQTPTTRPPNNMQEDLEDSDDTATAMQTPEEPSTESTTSPGSVDEDFDQGQHVDDLREREVPKSSPIDQGIDLRVQDASDTTQPPPKQEETVIEAPQTYQKIKTSTPANESSSHDAEGIDAVLKDPIRTRIAGCPPTDIEKNSISERSATDTENVNPDRIDKMTGPSEDTAKSAAGVRSMPPHLRQDRLAPRQYAAPVTRGSWPAQSPRPPRSPYPPSTYYNNRNPVDAAEYARMSARVMKIRDQLQAAQKENAEMRVQIETEKQKSLDAAMSDLLTDLLRKQAGALDMKAKAQVKQHELRYREQKIEQLEVFLSKGQKQFSHELEQRGIQPVSVLEAERIRTDSMLELERQFASTEIKLSNTSDRIRQQESVLAIREQQYKATIRDAVEREVREKMIVEMQDRTEDLKSAEAEYQCGFIEGRHIGRNEAMQETGRKHYLEGYIACDRTQTALYKVRSGRISTDSDELAFLFDLTRQENLFNLGREVGMMAGQNTKSMDERVADQGRARDTMTHNTQTKRVLDVEDGQVQETTNESAVKQYSVHSSPKSGPAYTSFPKCQTFASSLRGASNLHNGHVVLANSGASSPESKPIKAAVKVENTVTNLIDLS